MAISIPQQLLAIQPKDLTDDQLAQFVETKRWYGGPGGLSEDRFYTIWEQYTIGNAWVGNKTFKVALRPSNLPMIETAPVTTEHDAQDKAAIIPEMGSGATSLFPYYIEYMLRNKRVTTAYFRGNTVFGYTFPSDWQWNGLKF